MKMQKMLCLMLSLVIGCSLLTACAGGASSSTGASTSTASAVSPTTTPAETIKIGTIHPLTGNYAYEAQAIINAQQLAVDKINAAGGIASLGGAQLQLVVGDSQASADTGASEAERLVNEGCVALTGAFQSNVVQTTSQVAEENSVPYVVTVGNNVALFQRGFEYLYRLQPNAQVFSMNLIDYLSQLDLGDIKTAVLLHEDSITGTDNAKIIEDNFSQSGLTLLGNIAYSASATSLSTEVTKIADLAPDMLITIGYFADTAMLVSEMNERDLSFKLVCGVANGGISDTKFINDFGSVVENYCDLNYRYNPIKESTKTMMADYKATYGNDMSVHAIFGWQSIYVLADALERAGSAEPQKLNEALKATNYEEHDLAMSGPITFDETGENVNAAGVLLQIQDGAHKVIFPQEFAESQLRLN